jgi:hypothetical protein
MVLNELALIVPRPRPRRAWLIVLAAALLLATGGCGEHHRRESLRPIFRRPSVVAAPCTNCGPGSSAVVGQPIPGSPSRSLSSEPPIDGSSGGATESTVPQLEQPTSGTRSNGRSYLSEPAPKATIGDDPNIELQPSQSGKPRGSSPPSSSTSGKAPLLDGPGSASSLKSTDGLRTASATTKSRPKGVQERLRAYLGESGGNELFYPNKADRPWKYIVLHHSANPSGNYDQIDGEHRKVLGYDGCGYHFVIGNGTGSEDGRIEVAQRWVNQKHGVHCRNAKSAEIDEYGIGICFVGDLDKEPPTPRQVAAAKVLVAYLSTRYTIASRRVETHAHLAATPTVCPGRHFPAEAFLAASSPEPEPAARVLRAASTSWQAARQAGSSPF